MRTMLLLVLCLCAPVCEAAEWLTYCMTDKGVKVREDASKKWYVKVQNSGGGSVVVTTKKRLKHVQLTCTSTVEPICTVSAGENPAIFNKPDGEWAYQITGRVHSGGTFCGYFWVQT